MLIFIFFRHYCVSTTVEILFKVLKMKVKTKLESKSGKSKKSQQTLKKVKTKRKKVKSHAQDGSDFAKETTAPDYKVNAFDAAFKTP